ncbi:MAG: FeoB-associated Cys-rich membrane protein [Clostridia bacterium]|nr:FeoB-associated Cys-rich membrane protein [Clostridia bacterium]
MITDIIIVAVLVLIIGAAGFYVYKAKKSGKKCIGCPDSGSCGSHDKKSDGESCCCGCGGCKSSR